MREDKHIERIDEAVNEGKPTWEKPTLKVYPIHDTAAGAGTNNDGAGSTGSF